MSFQMVRSSNGFGWKDIRRALESCKRLSLFDAVGADGRSPAMPGVYSALGSSLTGISALIFGSTLASKPTGTTKTGTERRPGPIKGPGQCSSIFSGGFLHSSRTRAAMDKL